MSRRFVVLVLAFALVPLSAVPAFGDTSRFTDGDQTVHTDAVEALAQVGVVSGYGDGTYRPRQEVSRDQMATFLSRALRLPERSHDFEDVHPDSTHSGAIGAIARTSPPITQGCTSDRYCPREAVTRAQMATFLKRALDLPDDTSQSFDDVDPEDVHAPGIRAVAAAGITLGCGDGSGYCPTNPVQRDQMAAFLDRALGLDGPVPCPAVDGTATATSLGSAVHGFAVSTGVRTGTHLELLSMDLEVSRSARVPTGSGGISGSATIPRGTRTWASAATDEHVFVGQDTSGTNLYRYPSSNSDDRTVTPLASVPYGGEFWALAYDEAADRLWAGTRAHREQSDLADDEHVLYRVDDATGSTGSAQAVVFEAEDLPRQDDQRPDIKQLHWDPDEEQLFVGLGGSATFEGGARLYVLSDVDDPDGPEVEDITPTEVAADGLEIYSLDVTDTHVAVGTRSESRAQVALRERDGGEWTLATLPQGERRVDQVALAGDRVFAATFPSGRLWELGQGQSSLQDRGSASGAANQPTRFLEVDGDVVRGATSQGMVWTRPTSGGSFSPVPFSSRAGASDFTAAGLAHSLAVTTQHAVAGANNTVQARPLGSSSGRTAMAVGGEAKALATHGRLVWAATYPSATLYRLDPANGTSEQVGSWDGRYQRPRDATYSTRHDRVLVVARTDPAGASGLFSLHPDGSSAARGVRVTDGQNRNVQATSVATHGNYAYVGTYGAGVVGESGGVVAYDLRTMDKVWYARPARGEVVSLDVVGDRLVGVAHTNSSGSGNTWFELDPSTGQERAGGNDDTRLGRGPIGDATAIGPVTIGAMGRDVMSIQRGGDRATSLYQHDAHQTFAGPFIDVDRQAGRCDIYAIEGRDVFRLPYDPTTRLDR